MIRGWRGWALAAAVAVIVVVGFAPLKLFLSLRFLDTAHDVAVRRLAEPDGARGGSVAADFINIPIETVALSEGIFQVTGVANSHLIVTEDGLVMFDTGLATQVPKQMRALRSVVPDMPLTHILVSHAHADHQGGVKLWREAQTEVITHAAFPETQRYLGALQPYLWHRNRTLFPFMPAKPPGFGPLAYGEIVPDRLVRQGEVYSFLQGGVRFEVLALAGAEGDDNLLLWLPDKRILFSGDFFGPLFPQFPNIFTMRGEKIRKPVEYIAGLEMIMTLAPEMIVPSHKAPIIDRALIEQGLRDMRDATRHVHDAVIDGMNAGRSVYQLMAEINLPPPLTHLSQVHGRVSWAVRSIWEYYATWFHFDKTTALYEVPIDEVFGDILDVVDGSELLVRAETHVREGRPLQALHLSDILLSQGDDAPPALAVRIAALERLLAQAQAGLQNSYEIYWLTYRLDESRARLENAP